MTENNNLSESFVKDFFKIRAPNFATFNGVPYDYIYSTIWIFVVLIHFQEEQDFFLIFNSPINCFFIFLSFYLFSATIFKHYIFIKDFKKFNEKHKESIALLKLKKNIFNRKKYEMIKLKISSN